MDDTLKNIQQIWYQKLKQDGFQDIEDDSNNIFDWHSQKLRNKNRKYIDHAVTQEYYAIARDLLNTFPFKNKLHRQIWELYSEGYSKRKIEKILSTTENPYKRESIGLIICEIAKVIK